MSLRNRALGVLYGRRASLNLVCTHTDTGQAVGDALGARYEFGSRALVCERVDADTQDAGGGHLPLLGGGSFHVDPGQVTDDTEMAMALTRSMLGNRNRYSQSAAAKAYTNWIHTDPPDAALMFKNTGMDAAAIAATCVRNAYLLNGSSLSNGSLMRQSPLAIAYCQRTPDELHTAVEQDTQLTHSNPIVIVAGYTYTMAIRALLIGATNEEAYAQAIELCVGCPTVHRHVHAARERDSPIETDRGSVLGDTTAMGYIGVALQVAFHQLLHARSFEQGLVDAIRIGGDTDTNGCITGALLGARFGADSIPVDWRRTVVEAKPVRYQYYNDANMADIDHVVDTLLQPL